MEYAREFKKYKQQAYFLTKEALGGKPAPDCSQLEALPLYLTFYPPDKRKRDDDNMISSFKAGRDGIAQALGLMTTCSIFRSRKLANPSGRTDKLGCKLISGETSEKRGRS